MNKYRHLSVFIAFMLLIQAVIIPQAHAVENDQYVSWGAQIKDSVDVLNEYVNRHMRIQIQKANRGLWAYSCSALTFKIGWHFSREGIKKTDLWAEKNPEIEKFPANREDLGKDGVYRNIKKLRHAGRTINVNGVHIGVDKLSHTMAMGFVYWMKYRWKLRKFRKMYDYETAVRRAEEEAIKTGIWAEKTYTGLNRFASGMFSYADMESNYQGLLIYKSLCEVKNPRLKRYGRNWKWVGKQVDFREHVNPYWNEIYNPNYHAKRIWPLVEPLLVEYCVKGKDPAKVAEYERYTKWAQSLTPSYSQVYLSQRLEKGTIPDPRPQRLDNLCARQGETPVVLAPGEEERKVAEMEKVSGEEEEAATLNWEDEEKKEERRYSPSDIFPGDVNTDSDSDLETDTVVKDI